MAIDGPTLLLLSLGIAAIAAAFLVLEWRLLGERALLNWSAAFSAVVLGCAISPLRQGSDFIIGFWVADGLLIVTHLLFLRGFSQFTGRRVSRWWWATLAVWAVLLAPPLPDHPYLLLAPLNAALVALIALRTGALLVGTDSGRETLWPGIVMLVHGSFYSFKTAFALGGETVANLTAFSGLIVQTSLFEGIMVEVLLTLLMVGAVRRRREARIVALAERDPLTDVLNRRAFEREARRLLAALPPERRLGALLVLDLDHFKSVNDTFGHAIGDDTLIALTTILDALLPRNALIARLGGDEFVVLLPDAAPALVSALGDAVCGEFAQLNRGFRDVPVAATVSIGAAMIADTGRDLRHLMIAADAAAYQAKARGGDQVVLAEAAPRRAPKKVDATA
jgi:diguanylate cyclase (GGDEF)-like protein